MATAQSTADYLTGQMAAAGPVHSRKMFGEYAIYCDDKMVAAICDDQLFVKPTEPGRQLIGTPDEVPPYHSAKPYYRIPADRWDDHDWLSQLIRVTADALPAPKPKRR